MTPEIPDLMIPKIPGVPMFPRFLKTPGTVLVGRGVREEPVVVANPLVIGTAELFFEHDFIWTASEGNPFFISWVVVSAPLRLNRIATLVEVILMNRSGADDTYSLYIWNATTDEVLLTLEDWAIPNKAIGHMHTIIGGDKINGNDTIYLVVYDGVLGTTTDEPCFGKLAFNIALLTDAQSFQEWMGVEEL